MPIVWRPRSTGTGPAVLRAPHVVPLVLGVAVLAGCGGASRGDFAAEADRICQERIELFRQADEGAQTSNALIADAYEEELEKLRELEPPGELEDDFERLLELLDERTRRQREFADVQAEFERIGEGDDYAALSERLTAASTAANRTRVQANRAAKDLGLETCATNLT